MMWRGSVLDLNRPNVFIPTNPDNIIFSLEMNYEKMMLSFEENSISARSFTVFQFEVALKKNDDDIKSMRNENKQG